MAINKKHPLFQEYYGKCKVISEKFIEGETALRAKYPEWRGRDHPASAEIRVLELRCNAELKALQKEYSFLFESPCNIIS